MQKPLPIVAYIDGANLHRNCVNEGFVLDYEKFLVFLKERYMVDRALLFLGYLPRNKPLYGRLIRLGYELHFKKTILYEVGTIKGNCDTDLVLTAASDFYERRVARVVLVSSDGDFASLVRFFEERDVLEILLSPGSYRKCSSLLREGTNRIEYLPDFKEELTYEKRLEK